MTFNAVKTSRLDESRGRVILVLWNRKNRAASTAPLRPDPIKVIAPEEKFPVGETDSTPAKGAMTTYRDAVGRRTSAASTESEC